jgi:hypothetical protein
MVEAVARQQGQDALGVKLARRCLPGQDFCMTTLDAKLIGVGGKQEPQKVVVTVVTDVRDQNLHLARMVCTWPGLVKVCREFNTGKVITGELGQ